MKKSEMKKLVKEAMKESLNESFVANMVEIVIRTTEKTLEKKLDEKMEAILHKRLVLESKRIKKARKKKQIAKKPTTKKTAQLKEGQEKKVVLSKDPVINKMLKQTMLSTPANVLEDFGMKSTDASQLGEIYKKQMIDENVEGLNENAQLQIPTLSEDLGTDTLQGSVMDNTALAGVFKKDYRSTLKKMKENSGNALPEAVQFFEAK